MYRYINTNQYLQDYERINQQRRIEIVLEFYHSGVIKKM
jgi:hypothetical protein